MTKRRRGGSSIPPRAGFAAACCAVLLGAACAAFGADPSRLPAPLSNWLAQAGIPETGIGLVVQEVGATQPVLTLGPDRPMRTASVMKLVTTLAALETLGPAATWRTEVYAAGPLSGDVLEGDLLIKGSGDPQLTQERLWMLLRELRQRGIREIRGDLVLDGAVLAPAADDPGRFDGRGERPYNALPDGLLMNYQAVALRFVPGMNGAVGVLLEPALPQLQLINRLTLDDGPCGDWQSRLGLKVLDRGERAVILMSGAFSSQCGEKTDQLRVLNSPAYDYGLFRLLWEELGGVLTGGVRTAGAAPAVRLLAAAESPPLAELVRAINKNSNNVMARQIFLGLGARVLGAPGTPEKGAAAVRQWLAGKGLDFPELVMENGAGLSRSESISPRHLADLLLAAHAGPLMPEFIASLPLAAVDGTMKRRLNGSPASGRAYIKTGYLAGVRAMAGYVLDRRGRWIAVVCFINHPQAVAGRAFLDGLLEWAYGLQ